jgi:hypothetical protein
MQNLQDAKTLKMVIDQATSPPSATIGSAALATSQSPAPPNGTNPGSSNSNNQQTPAPTTAVAMSILYSITGIITLLFLVIIATGAVRAHRHPERYGPRGGFPGRPRQSRAKGLARAMLETIPIIKFGDPDPPKPGSQDVELQEGVSEIHPAPVEEVDAITEKVEGEPQVTKEVAPVPESGIGPNIRTTESPSPATAGPAPELGCSICTEDFEKGQDVRVLPCNHKYHPACIDPWLLNVSGTCPLW